jgi:molybdopterin converting factor small subunit
MSNRGEATRRNEVRVLLYGAWRSFAGGAKEVQLDAATMHDALEGLAALHPSLRERLRDEHGKLRAHLALFVNDEDARLLGWEDATLRDGDVVHIIPALSGG